MPFRRLPSRFADLRVVLIVCSVLLTPAAVQAQSSAPEPQGQTPADAAAAPVDTNPTPADAAEVPAAPKPDAPVAPPTAAASPTPSQPVADSSVAQPSPAPQPATSVAEPTGAWPVSAWIVGGVGGALLIAGSVAGIVALKKNRDIDEVCPRDVCTPATAKQGRKLQDTRDTAVIFADVGVVGGLACLAAATYLVLDRGRSEKTRPEAAALEVTPLVSASGAALLGRVRF